MALSQTVTEITRFSDAVGASTGPKQSLIVTFPQRVEVYAGLNTSHAQRSAVTSKPPSAAVFDDVRSDDERKSDPLLLTHIAKFDPTTSRLVAVVNSSTLVSWPATRGSKIGDCARQSLSQLLYESSPSSTSTEVHSLHTSTGFNRHVAVLARSGSLALYPTPVGSSSSTTTSSVAVSLVTPTLPSPDCLVIASECIDISAQLPDTRTNVVAVVLALVTNSDHSLLSLIAYTISTEVSHSNTTSLVIKSLPSVIPLTLPTPTDASRPPQAVAAAFALTHPKSQPSSPKASLSLAFSVFYSSAQWQLYSLPLSHLLPTGSTSTPSSSSSPLVPSHSLHLSFAANNVIGTASITYVSPSHAVLVAVAHPASSSSSSSPNPNPSTIAASSSSSTSSPFGGTPEPGIIALAAVELTYGTLSTAFTLPQREPDFVLHPPALPTQSLITSSTSAFSSSTAAASKRRTKSGSLATSASFNSPSNLPPMARTRLLALTMTPLTPSDSPDDVAGVLAVLPSGAIHIALALKYPTLHQVMGRGLAMAKYLKSSATSTPAITTGTSTTSIATGGAASVTLPPLSPLLSPSSSPSPSSSSSAPPLPLPLTLSSTSNMGLLSTPSISLITNTGSKVIPTSTTPTSTTASTSLSTSSFSSSVSTPAWLEQVSSIEYQERCALAWLFPRLAPVLGVTQGWPLTTSTSTATTSSTSSSSPLSANQSTKKSGKGQKVSQTDTSDISSTTLTTQQTDSMDLTPHEFVTRFFALTTTPLSALTKPQSASKQSSKSHTPSNANSTSSMTGGSTSERHPFSSSLCADPIATASKFDAWSDLCYSALNLASSQSPSPSSSSSSVSTSQKPSSTPNPPAHPSTSTTIAPIVRIRGAVLARTLSPVTISTIAKYCSDNLNLLLSSLDVDASSSLSTSLSKDSRMLYALPLRVLICTRSLSARTIPSVLAMLASLGQWDALRDALECVQDVSETDLVSLLSRVLDGWAHAEAITEGKKSPRSLTQREKRRLSAFDGVAGEPLTAEMARRVLVWIITSPVSHRFLRFELKALPVTHIIILLKYLEAWATLLWGYSPKALLAASKAESRAMFEEEAKGKGRGANGSHLGSDGMDASNVYPDSDIEAGDEEKGNGFDCGDDIVPGKKRKRMGKNNKSKNDNTPTTQPKKKAKLSSDSSPSSSSSSPFTEGSNDHDEWTPSRSEMASVASYLLPHGTRCMPPSLSVIIDWASTLLDSNVARILMLTFSDARRTARQIHNDNDGSDNDDDNDDIDMSMIDGDDVKSMRSLVPLSEGREAVAAIQSLRASIDRHASLCKEIQSLGAFAGYLREGLVGTGNGGKPAHPTRLGMASYSIQLMQI